MGTSPCHRVVLIFVERPVRFPGLRNEVLKCELAQGCEPLLDLVAGGTQVLFDPPEHHHQSVLTTLAIHVLAEQGRLQVLIDHIAEYDLARLQ